MSARSEMQKACASFVQTTKATCPLVGKMEAIRILVQRRESSMASHGESYMSAYSGKIRATCLPIEKMRNICFLIRSRATHLLILIGFIVVGLPVVWVLRPPDIG